MSDLKKIETVKALSKWIAGSGSKYLPPTIPAADAKSALADASFAMSSEFPVDELADLVSSASAMGTIVKSVMKSDSIVMFNDEVEARLASLEKGVSRGRKILRRMCKRIKK